MRTDVKLFSPFGFIGWRTPTAEPADDPLDDACLADVNALAAFVKDLRKLFPEVEVEF